MRSTNKSRSRNKNNRKSYGNVTNRVFDSAGPEGKVRGTPQQIIEKYQTLARDSQLSGDRVAMENFHQHAEHYQRMLNDAQRQQQEQNANRRDQQQSEQPQQAQPDVVKDQPADQPSGNGLTTLDSERSDSGLVELPEATKPKRNSSSRRPRKPKEDKAAADAPQAEADSGSEKPAAEKAEPAEAPSPAVEDQPAE